MALVGVERRNGRSCRDRGIFVAAESVLFLRCAITIPLGANQQVPTSQGQDPCVKYSQGLLDTDKEYVSQGLSGMDQGSGHSVDEEATIHKLVVLSDTLLQTD